MRRAWTIVGVAFAACLALPASAFAAEAIPASAFYPHIGVSLIGLYSVRAVMHDYLDSMKSDEPKRGSESEAAAPAQGNESERG